MDIKWNTKSSIQKKNQIKIKYKILNKICDKNISDTKIE